MTNNGVPLIEREEQVKLLHLALTAGEHIVFIGPPGTAKTALVQRVAEASGLSTFIYLLTAFTTPDEIFGPVDIEKLKSGIYSRKVKGFAPTTQLVFLDEIFKANKAILNSLLRLMQERKFAHEPPQEIDCPLITLVGASNEIPTDMEALWDRFMLRCPMKYISKKGRLQALLQEHTNGIDYSWKPNGLAQLTKEVANGINELADALAKEGIVLSDRRVIRSANIVRAYAAMQGKKETDLSDLLVLKYVFWQKPEDLLTIERLAAFSIDKDFAELQNLMRDVEQLWVNWESDKDNAETVFRAVQLTRVANDLITKVQTKNLPEEVQKQVANYTKTIEEIQGDLLRKPKAK